MNIKDTLFSLAPLSGTAGSEKNICDTLVKLLSEYGRSYTDINSSAVCEIDGDGGGILLDAHLDTIGFTVTEVYENGFLKIDRCGGIDLRTLPAHDVTVHGKKDIFGVITSVPPHLSKGDGKTAAPIDELLVDTGLDGNRISEFVSLGDRVTFKSQYRTLLNNTACGAYFDNRAGVVTILRSLEILKEKGCKKKITVLFSSQEETGHGGATGAGFSCGDSECICVDVSFAKTKDTPREISAVLGGGPMIGFAPVLSRSMGEMLEKIAGDNDIPCQKEIMSGATGTNADTLALSHGGKRTALISLPLKNMHTGCEVVSFDDIELSARLISEYILSGGCRNA